MIKLPFKVSFEQAVYGSFPFWRRGYAVLTQSPGCRPEWIAALKLAAQRFGEPPVGAIAAESFFALQLESGPWMVVGVAPRGTTTRAAPARWHFTRFSSVPGPTSGWVPIRSGSRVSCAAPGVRPIKIKAYRQAFATFLRSLKRPRRSRPPMVIHGSRRLSRAGARGPRHCSIARAD